MYMGMVMLTTTSLAKVEVTKILMTGSCTKERFSVKAITKSRPLFVLIARGILRTMYQGQMIIMIPGGLEVGSGLFWLGEKGVGESKVNGGNIF